MFGWISRRELEMLWRQGEELGRRLDHLRDDLKEIDSRRRDDKRHAETADTKTNNRINTDQGNIRTLYGYQQMSALRSEALGAPEFDMLDPTGGVLDDDPEKEKERTAMLEERMGDPMGGGYNAYDLIDDEPQDANGAAERPEVDTEGA